MRCCRCQRSTHAARCCSTSSNAILNGQMPSISEVFSNDARQEASIKATNIPAKWNEMEQDVDEDVDVDVDEEKKKVDEKEKNGAACAATTDQRRFSPLREK